MLTAGVPRRVAEPNTQAFALIADGDAAETTDDVRNLTGRAPRTHRSFHIEHLEAFPLAVAAVEPALPHESQDVSKQPAKPPPIVRSARDHETRSREQIDG